MLKKLSLQKRLSISISIVLSLCLTLITIYSYKESSELIKHEAFTRAMELGKNRALALEQKINSAFIVARSLSQSTMALKRSKSFSREAVIEILKDNLNLDPLYFGIGLYFEKNAFDGKDDQFKNDERFGNIGRVAPWIRRDKEKGMTLEPSNSDEMETPGVGDWYLKPKNSLKESIIEPYAYPLSDKTTVTIMSPSVPIIVDNKFIGLSALDIQTDSLQKIVEEIKPYETGYAELISSELKYIYHPDNKLIDQPISDKFNLNFKKGIENGEVSELETEDLYKVLIPIKLGNTGKFWGLLINIPKDKVLAGTKKLASIQLTMSAVSLILITIVIIFLSLGITKPLTEQNTKVENVAVHLNNYAEELLRISKGLAESSIAQSDALIETSTAMDEINSMVARNNDSARKSKISSDRSKSIATEGKNSSELMTQSMHDIERSNNQISAQTEKGNKDIGEIIRIFEHITEKTKVINDIVFQTKLLSFNASVEAARAGENGKGFAVVAEEIGKLAEVSGNSAKEISEILNESSDKVNRIILDNQKAIEILISDSTNNVSSGIRIVEDFKSKLDEIYISADEVSQLVNEIVDASAEQTVGVGEISKAINHLDYEALQNSSQAKIASASAAKVKDNSDDLKSIIKELDKLVNGEKKIANENYFSTLFRVGLVVLISIASFAFL